MESAGVRYLRTSCFLSEIEQVSAANEWDFWYVNNSGENTVQSTFHVVLCLLYTFIILPAFYFKSFQNPKMPKYTFTYREMTKKTK